MTHSQEVHDLSRALDRHRAFLLQTADGLDDERARRASTASALSIASILKHVADTEAQWMDFAVRGAEAFAGPGDADAASTPDGEAVNAGEATDEADAPEAPDPRFALSLDETLPVLRERVLDVGARTTELLSRLDLDSTHALPDAPWFEPGETWSVRRVALHLIAEISQHAGHADIIRESIDGARTMG